jgi:hypothetical protein
MGLEDHFEGGSMNRLSKEQHEAFSIERRLLEVLRQKGPQTLETLCALPGLSWSQVLLAVDHLSRSREVAIEPIAPCEYQVSLNGVMS